MKPGADKVYKRSRVEVTKFGKVDCYVCVKFMPEGSTGQEMRVFSDKMFSLASRHRTGPPLGFGAMLVVYPLIITENITADLAESLKSYCPKHFAAAEFPSALDLSTGYVLPSNTPVWLCLLRKLSPRNISILLTNIIGRSSDKANIKQGQE
jgi:hypothetical protein